MQLQKTLQQSIRKCHQRRLQKLCSIKKKLGSWVKTPNPQNNQSSRILAEIQNELESKTILMKRTNTGIESVSPEISSADQHLELITEIRENREELEEAKRDIRNLERHMGEVEEELGRREESGRVLEEKNSQLELEILEAGERLEQEKRNTLIKENHIQDLRARIELVTRQLAQSKELIKSFEIATEGHQSVLRQINTLNSKLTQRVGELQQDILEIKGEMESTQQMLGLKQKQYTVLLAEHYSLQKNYKRTMQENQTYRNKVSELQKEKTASDSQFYSTKTSNIQQQLQICQLQSKLSDLSEAISQNHREKQDKNRLKQDLQLRWQSIVQTPIQIDPRHYCCQHQLKFKYLQLLLQLISSSQCSLQLLCSLQPTFYHSLKHLLQKNTIRPNGSLFSLSCSFHRILGSYQEIAKMSQNEISNFIEQQDENQVSSPEQFQKNHEELLARMEEEVQNMSSSHGVNRTDVSQLKENFNAVKTINEQLFHEVESKQKQIKEMAGRLKFYQNYSGIVEHLKASVGTLSKEIKSPSPKVGMMLENIRSLLTN